LDELITVSSNLVLELVLHPVRILILTPNWTCHMW